MTGQLLLGTRPAWCTSKYPAVDTIFTNDVLPVPSIDQRLYGSFRRHHQTIRYNEPAQASWSIQACFFSTDTHSRLAHGTNF